MEWRAEHPLQPVELGGPAMVVVSIYSRLLNRLFWPKHMTLGDKLFRLAVLAPEEYHAIELLVDDALQRHRPAPRARKDRF